MRRHRFVSILIAMVAVFAVAAATDHGTLKGTFVVGGADAKLKYVRVLQRPLDGGNGKLGYTVLLTERPATGDPAAWKTAEPAKAGSFISIQFEPTGAVWIADLGHTKAKSSRFGVMTEIKVPVFKVNGGRLSAHITTNGEQVFTDDHYSIDITFDAPIEKS